jgi:tryptophanyl-tRNA synthetase
MRDGPKIAEYSLDIVASWLALGLDVKNNLIFRQSDIPLVTEYAWYLSCVTGVGFLEKAHAYKDAASQNNEVNHGVFAYPVLMAADILLYEPDVVPVGKDQKQHVEMARNMAGSFNAAFGQGIIKLPEPLIEEKVMTIPGLDGRKMSKSYNNYVPIFCDEKQLRKKIMSMTTDSTSVDEPKSLSGSLVGDLFELFATKDEYKDLSDRLAKGGMGWGHAKEELFVVINRELSEPRQKYKELRADEKSLLQILNESTSKAYQMAVNNLNKLRLATGMRPYPYQYSLTSK